MNTLKDILLHYINKGYSIQFKNTKMKNWIEITLAIYLDSGHLSYRKMKMDKILLKDNEFINRELKDLENKIIEEIKSEYVE